MNDAKHLSEKLLNIDGKGYPAYKSIKGSYDFEEFQLIIDHVQGDPYAAPSKIRVRLVREVAQIPSELTNTTSRRIGVCSHLAGVFTENTKKYSGRKGSGKSGLLTMDGPGQEVLLTTAVTMNDDYVEARFFAGLPARGRRVLGRRAEEMFLKNIPALVKEALLFRNLDQETLAQAARTNEDAENARRKLQENGLIAFVANGAILPRLSGVDNRPMRRGAVPFQSPPSLEVQLTLPNAGEVTGMGIPQGVTLIVGGGFHGKSTLLEALERGIYNHRAGDGRELVVTDPTAVKIRAEDGRAVSGVNISPFISNLPGGIKTTDFSSQNASGSTSQAANIIEALEIGSKTLLLDEDTSATNFMIRDSRMQALISKEHEPITPFVDKVKKLWSNNGVSTVLVMGGSGDYFEVADCVIAMEEYRPKNVTLESHKIVESFGSNRCDEGSGGFGSLTFRKPLPQSLDPSKGKRTESVKSRGVKTVLFGTDELDLSSVAQIVHPGQLRAIGDAMLKIKHLADGEKTLNDLLNEIEEGISEHGLDFLSQHPTGNLSEFRRYELGAALNRLRTLRTRA